MSEKISGKGGFDNPINDRNKTRILKKKLSLDSIEIRFTVQKNQHKVQNLISVIEGSNLLLKEECLVFVAHYDHLGTDSTGNVFNGADDNASGVSVLMELHRLFAGMQTKPERSIVFLWAVAEEIGLLGSEYYTRNPVLPLNKTACAINLDMVGRVAGEKDLNGKNQLKPLKGEKGIFTLVSPFCPELKVLTDSVSNILDIEPDHSLPEMFLFSSDHYNFHKYNIPILNLSTGHHPDYHKITDDSEKMDFEKMQKVTSFCFNLGNVIANRNKRFEIVNIKK
jgi:Zn-dependent M28 family amino/carboxypeptidase